MKNNDDILKYLREEGENLEIPKSLEPEQMRKRLKQESAQNSAKKQKRKFVNRKRIAIAATICLVFLGAFSVVLWQGQPDDESQSEIAGEKEQIQEEAVILETAELGLEYPKIRYEDIYASMSVKWKESGQLNRGEMTEAGMMMDGVVMESAAVEESAPVSDMAAEKSMNSANDADYGKTNLQTVGVDEGDIVKNDGRFLYQKIRVEEENSAKWVIQIIDTKEGLKEVGRVEDIDSLVEFYVWKDTLVVIEEKYLDKKETSARKSMIVCYDVAYFDNYYHEITIFDIKDRSQPKELKMFTLQGQYTSSRISDGYFYGFSKYYASPGNGEEDYDAYIPIVDGIRMQADNIFLPKDTNATTYLVLVAIDLKNPTKFTDTTGIVSGADHYYVSAENIFVADAKPIEMKQGWSSDTTELFKFSYGNGKFSLQATGEVKGRLDGSFSMDEYEEHLRVVTTVWEYQNEEIIDDRTGETLGWNTSADRQSNALYVLDEKLDVVGKIEDLAPNEQIYSARFMGDTGYFVTFRQVDPLFTVDLSNPKEPKVLSELKVSGFSEYLHIYGEDRLLGIGMEADEETGRQEGMKLSMFDVSDKTNVTEIAKENLKKYEYSEVLYNHRAVMISVGKNIFGFEAEGYQGSYYKDYVVFTYEDDTFLQKLKVSTKSNDGGYYSARGTFIGDVFYLLLGDGSVRSYDLNTGEQLESLEP